MCRFWLLSLVFVIVKLNHARMPNPCHRFTAHNQPHIVCAKAIKRFDWNKGVTERNVKEGNCGRICSRMFKKVVKW